MIFRDRREAGQALAGLLRDRAPEQPLVLALPRGGVPVAYEVARALDAPLDVFLVRKVGAPGQEELAMGAVASGGLLLVSEDVVRMLGVGEEALLRAAESEGRELARRERRYRRGRPPLEVRGRSVIVVDDGLATGASMRAAVAALRRRGPRRLVVAVPVGARPARARLAEEQVEMVCAATPEPFRAVGLWYQDFSPVSDAEVEALLSLARGRRLEERP